MDLQIILLADGFLLGFTYFGKGDNVVDEEVDWAEFNLYLGIAKITWRFF